MSDLCRAPLLPCAVCDVVPGRPDLRDGSWRIVCPVCGREAVGPTEDRAREIWAIGNATVRSPTPIDVQRIDSVIAVMCDLEAVRTVPGAMNIWHEWMDAAERLKAILQGALE